MVASTCNEPCGSIVVLFLIYYCVANCVSLSTVTDSNLLATIKAVITEVVSVTQFVYGARKKALVSSMGDTNTLSRCTDSF